MVFLLFPRVEKIRKEKKRAFQLLRSIKHFPRPRPRNVHILYYYNYKYIILTQTKLRYRIGAVYTILYIRRTVVFFFFHILGWKKIVKPTR